jgi:hypothetical protein
MQRFLKNNSAKSCIRLIRIVCLPKSGVRIKYIRNAVLSSIQTCGKPMRVLSNKRPWVNTDP